MKPSQEGAGVPFSLMRDHRSNFESQSERFVRVLSTPLMEPPGCISYMAVGSPLGSLQGPAQTAEIRDPHIHHTSHSVSDPMWDWDCS